MTRFLLSIASLVSLAIPVAAQPGGAPPDCQCTNGSNSFPGHEDFIGDVYWTGSCSVTTQGGQDQCAVAGTITLEYCPQGGFSPDLMDTPLLNEV